MEAAGEATHTTTDVRFAAHMAAQFGDRLLTEIPGLRLKYFRTRTHAATLLRDIVLAVQKYNREVHDEQTPELPPSWRRDYLHSITSAIRVIGRTRAALGGVPILARTESPVEGCAVFNIFNPLAIESLVMSTTDHDGNQPHRPIQQSQSWRTVARLAIPKTPWVKLVEPSQASRGFIALLADSMRTAFQAFARRREERQPLVIDGRTHGYLLRVTDEFAYDPVAFGSTETYEVSGDLRPGRYRFEGVCQGRLCQDLTTYSVTEGTTRLFLDGV